MAGMNPKFVAALTDERKSRSYHIPLWPRMWEWFRATYPRYEANWQRCKLEQGQLAKIPNVAGVYTLIVEPDIIAHERHHYLMYVGSSKDLKERFKDYLTKRGSNEDVTTLLERYSNYLWFVYFTVADESYKEKEENIITATQPPLNVKGLTLKAEVLSKTPAFGD